MAPGALVRELVRDYVVGAAPRGGGTAADLAWRLGVSRQHASSLLGDLPARLVLRTERSPSGTAFWLPTTPAPPERAAEAWASFSRACLVFRRGMPTRQEQIRRDCETARQLLAAGEMGGLRRLLRSPGLEPAAVRRAVPPPWRDPMSADVLHLHADAAMQRGDHEQAVALAREALARSSAPETQAGLLTVLGAALRMQSEEGPARSVAAYESGMEAASRVEGESGRRLRRHALAGSVAPLLVLGDAARALANAQGSLDLATTDEEAAESRLRLVQALSAAGRESLAQQRHEELIRRLPPLPRWLRGWAMRFGPAFVPHCFHDEAWNHATAAAWSETRGYQFQRLLLLARIAANPGRFVPDAWPPAALRDLTLAASLLHKRTHGRGPRLCGQCRRYSLPAVAAHALMTAPGLLHPHYCT